MGQDSNPQTVQRGINVKSQTAVNGILSVEGKVKHNPEYSFWLQGNLAVDNLSGIEGHNYIEYGISAPLEFINNNYQSRIIPEIALSQLGSESYQQLVGVTFDTSVFFRRYFISGELGFHNSSKLNDKLIHLDGNLINVGLGLFRYSPRSKLGLMVKYRNDQLENQPTEFGRIMSSLSFMGGRKLSSVTSWGIEFGVGETEYDAVTGIETRKDNFQRGKFNIDLSTSFGITFSGKYIYDRVRSNRVTLTSYTYEQHRFGLEIKGDL